MIFLFLHELCLSARRLTVLSIIFNILSTDACFR